MGWTNIKLIFARELRDQLRDRRTLFMVLILPLILYPTLALGMSFFVTAFEEKARIILVMGHNNLPEHPPLLGENGFAPELFAKAEDAQSLQVILEPSTSQTAVELARRDLNARRIDAVLIIPENTRELIANDQRPELKLLQHSANESSRSAFLRLRRVLDTWVSWIVTMRLQREDLNESVADPVGFEDVDMATTDQAAGGMIWGKLFPFLLVIMSLTGAFYPAVDLCAGEKERGTMETLLISPAARSEIVMGKYLTIWLFSVITAIVNLMAMTATGWAVARQTVGIVGKELPILALPGIASAFWMFLVLLPLSAFFSAVAIAIAAYARSTKEGQYYLTPLFTFTMPLVLITLAPGVDLNPYYSMVPITGAALLLESLLQAQYTDAFRYFIPVLLPIVLFAGLALRWAVDQFNREEVLFRSAERLDLRLWIRNIFRDREELPSGTEAMFCFVIMLLLQCALFLTGGITSQSGNFSFFRSMMVVQLVVVATPALMMTLMLTTSFRKTLLITLSPLKCFVFAVLLVLAMHPMTLELSGYLEQQLPVPKWLEESLKLLTGNKTSLLLQLFVVALLPAVCEEIAFRGFILSGLLRGTSVPSAVIISGILFGLFHLSPYQLFPATILGVLLAIIAVRSGSLLPCIAFHFVNNATSVMLGHFHAEYQLANKLGEPVAYGWVFQTFFRETQADGFVYRLPILILSIMIAAFVLTWFLKQPNRSPSAVSKKGPKLGPGLFGTGALKFSTELNTLSTDPHDAVS